MASIQVLLDQGGPCLTVLMRGGIGPGVDHFGCVLEFNTTVKVCGKVIMVWNRRKYLVKFGLDLGTQMLEFLLCCKYLNTFMHSGDDIHRFHIFEGMHCPPFSLVAHHV